VPTSVLIDTDPGIDDAVAIALAAALDALSVVALTAVHGNVEVERAARNAREVARRTGLRAPVVAGAAAPLVRPPQPARATHGEEGLGYVRPATPPIREPDRAAQTIIEAARRHPGLTLCCLGPLTNLARALEHASGLGARLGRVVVMGGTPRVPGTVTPWSEFNWWADPEAADAVLRAGLELQLVPLDVTRRIAVPGSAIRSLAASGAHDPEARFWADALRFYADFHRSHESFDGCVINDALAVALVADPTLATWRETTIRVSCSDDAYRGAVCEHAAGHRVRVASDVRAEDALRLVGRRVFARWLPEDALVPGAAAALRWLEAQRAHAPRPPPPPPRRSSGPGEGTT
jgi:purine nucleosidase